MNALLIAVESIIGRFSQGIPDKMKETVMRIIGFAVSVLGIKMGIMSDYFIVIIVNLVIGTIIRE